MSARLTLLSRGGASPARLQAEARAAVVDRVSAVVPPPDGTLLAAVAFGIHGTLPPATRRSLQDAGLIHLVATSGLKVVVVIAIVARLLGLASAGPRTRRGLSVLAVAGYIGLAGGGAAAVRSAVMATVGLGLAGSDRRAEPLPLLGVVAALMLLADPRLAADLGFQLSFVGTLGILLLAGRLAGRLPGPRLLAEPFAVTLAAQLATLPITASAFGTVSLVGPFANALAVPLVAPLIVCASLGVALGGLAAPLGAPPLYLAQLLTRAIAEIGGACAALPGAALHLPGWPRSWTWAELGALAAGGAAVVLARRCGVPRGGGDAGAGWSGSGGGEGRRRLLPWRPGWLAAGGLAAAFGAASVLVVAARPDGRLHVTVLDAGSAVAVLVRTPDGATALVDVGADPTRLLDGLGAELPAGARGIDLLVLSGGERAVAGALPGIAGHLDVRRVVAPAGPLGTAARNALLSLRSAGAEVIGAPPGAAWSWGGAAWRFLDLGAPDDGDAAPTSALVAVEVAAGRARALLLGDAPAPLQEELAASSAASLGDPLLVAPPSGLVAPALLEAVRPQGVAIPCSRAPTVALAGIPRRAVRLTAADGPLRYGFGAGGLEGP